MFRIPKSLSVRKDRGFDNFLNFKFSDVSELHEIGNGSYGIVYKGRFQGNDVVVKKIRGEGDFYMKQLLKECNLLHKIKHENISEFRGVCSEPMALLLNYECFNFNCFGLDKCVNNLRQFLNYVDIIEDASDFHDLFNSMALDICHGMQHLHDSGIAHRDVKPANILVSNEHYSRIDPSTTNFAETFQQKPILCKLTDFGESRSNIVRTNSVMKATTARIDRGSIPYMAPEILVPSFRLEKACLTDLFKMDIWATGMVFYNMTSPDVQHPYQLEAEELGTTDHISFRDLLAGKLANRADFRPRCSAKYCTVEKRKKWAAIITSFEKCTSLDPAERPQFQHLIEGLKQWFKPDDEPDEDPGIKDPKAPASQTPSDVPVHPEDNGMGSSLTTKIPEADKLYVSESHEDEPPEKLSKANSYESASDNDDNGNNGTEMASGSREDSVEMETDSREDEKRGGTSTRLGNDKNRPVSGPVEFAIMGDFHQASETEFHHDAKGSQCSSISMIAVLASKIKQPKSWTSSDINTIVRQGDRVHLEVLQNHGWPYLREEVMLDLDEMPDTFECSFGDCNVKASVGCLTGAYYDLDILSLLSRASDMPNTAYVLRLRDRCYALIRCTDGSLCLFDSHACNPLGVQDPDGTACAAFFKNIDDLAAHLDTNVGSGMTHEQVDMTPIEIEILETKAAKSDSLNDDAASSLNSAEARDEQLDITTERNSSRHECSYFKGDQKLPIFSRKTERFTPKEAIAILLQKEEIEECSKVPQRVRENKAFLIDVTKLASPDDVKADTNGVFNRMLRVAVWTVRVMHDGEIVILQKKRGDIPEGSNDTYHLSMNCRKNLAGLCRSIFMLYSRDGQVVANRCILQYNIEKTIGVSRVNYEVAPHGNRKHGKDPFFPMQKSTLSILKSRLKEGGNAAVVYNEINNHVGGAMAAEHPGQLPRSRQQCYQMKTHQKPEDDNADLSLYNSSLANPIVIDHYDQPKDVWIIGTKQMSSDLFKFCCTEGKSYPFSVDPTFGFGKYEVTPFTYRHMLLTNKRSGGPPIFLGPTAVHLNKETESYDRIISSVIHSCPPQMKSAVKGYITDGEAALCNSLQDHFPNAVGLRCFRHFRGNCERKLKKLGFTTKQDQAPFLDLVFGKNSRGGLVDSKDAEDLDGKMESMRQKCHDKMAEKFFNYIERNRNMMADHMIMVQRTLAGMPSNANGHPTRPTTNQSESLNNILTRQKEAITMVKKKSKNLSKVDFVKNVWEPVQEYQVGELQKALCGSSLVFQLSEEAEYLKVDQETWYTWSEQQREHYVTGFTALTMTDVARKKKIDMLDTATSQTPQPTSQVSSKQFQMMF